MWTTYNTLLKKRRDLIDVHKKACVEVEKVHTAIKANDKVRSRWVDSGA